MASQHFNSLRALELRLLRCTLPSDHHHLPSQHQRPPSPPAVTIHHLHAFADQLISLIESGLYSQALSSPAAETIFKSKLSSFVLNDSPESANSFYSEVLPEAINAFFNSNDYSDLGDEELVEKCYKALLLMAIGIAAFLAFTQRNVTGPSEKLPPVPLIELALCKESPCSGNWAEWEAWAQREIMSIGCELRGKFINLQYIVFAKILLLRTKDLLFEVNISSMDGVRSISWWLARLFFFQQKMLDERSSTLYDLLQVFMHERAKYFDSLENITNYWGSKLIEEDALAVASMLHLETGLVELTYGRIDSSRMHFESAAVASRLNYSVSGALGFRTLHQVEPKAQLRLVTDTNGNSACASQIQELQSDVSAVAEDATFKHTSETFEASDVLMNPRFLEEGKNLGDNVQSPQDCSTSATQLSTIQQAVILAQCLAIEKSGRNDELQKWEMAPYIEAIHSQQSSHFMIQYFCDILRIRWESTRSRTKQRALLMMDKLVQCFDEPSPGAGKRMYYCFAVDIPTTSALRKEYGDLLVSCGLIGEAVKVYEDLELWDNLIYCYRLLEKKPAAVELIKTRLSEAPSDPRLWCSLGDVTNDDACYEKAIEVSGSRSARAKRSLARSAYNKGDYETSKILWESAMALNSLYPDGWFALGAAALKARDIDKALDGFTRAVQLDPENGEAWNNIACLHMVKKRSREAFIAFKEALKLKRNSWQMWENFSHVAADVGNFSQAMEAVQKVLDMTKNKRTDAELLERMMAEIEKRISASHSQFPDVNEIQSYAGSVDAVSDVNHDNKSKILDANSAGMRETDHLIQLLGKILRQIVQSGGGGGEIWGLYARWHKLKGDLTMCCEALLKQVRSYQGSDLWRDRDRFLKFAHSSLELCSVYKELASQNGSHRELFAAEMHLKNTIKQAGNFSDTEEFQGLVACLNDVQKALQSNTASAA